MSPSTRESSSGSLGRTIVAILVLLVVGYFLLHVLIGVAVAIAGIAVVVLAVVGVIWALKVLF
ncbi:MAG: hypothetical protein WAU77_14190 [Solirubrobacteraceae bacterium]